MIYTIRARYKLVENKWRKGQITIQSPYGIEKFFFLFRYYGGGKNIEIYISATELFSQIGLAYMGPINEYGGALIKDDDSDEFCIFVSNVFTTLLQLNEAAGVYEAQFIPWSSLSYPSFYNLAPC